MINRTLQGLSYLIERLRGSGLQFNNWSLNCWLLFLFLIFNTSEIQCLTTDVECLKGKVYLYVKIFICNSRIIIYFRLYSYTYSLRTKMLQELNSDSKLKTRRRPVSSTGLQNYKALNKITSTYVNINISSLIKKHYPPAPTL